MYFFFTCNKIYRKTEALMQYSPSHQNIPLINNPTFYFAHDRQYDRYKPLIHLLLNQKYSLHLIDIIKKDIGIFNT